MFDLWGTDLVVGGVRERAGASYRLSQARCNHALHHHHYYARALTALTSGPTVYAPPLGGKVPQVGQPSPPAPSYAIHLGHISMVKTTIL